MANCKDQWKSWEVTKDGVFRKYYGKTKYIDALMGLFYAYKENHCMGRFWTLKEAEAALGKKK